MSERVGEVSRAGATARYALPVGAKLNIGSGPFQPDGWVNLDGSYRAFLTARVPWIDRAMTRARLVSPSTFRAGTVYANLFNGLPFADASAACAYAGEVWEHFEYDDALKLTAECFRVLTPGGVLRLCVPDGMQFWPKYVALVEAELAKPRAERRGDAIRTHLKWFFDDICTRPTHFKSFGHFHKWQFDEVQLIEMLEICGFTDVARMPFHVSRISDIGVVERSDFLIVEGVKPAR